MKKSLLFCAALMALLIAGTIRVAGQEARATIGGRVIDGQGAVVANARVIVTSDDTGVSQSTTTNADGNWTVPFLLPGHYHFTITSPGFKQAEAHGIELQTADHKSVDVELALGAATEHVTVTAESPLIDTTSATSGTVISEKQVLETPSNSRVVTLFAVLSPGVLQQDQNNNVFQLWSFNAASQFTVNGGTNNSRSNAFELDGLPNMMYGGKVAFIAPPDAIQEFRVQMNAYDASIGRQAGGTIQMSTKSGGSSYHGNLYEFNQTNVLDASYFQANLSGTPKPAVHYNEFGGTFGGPVWIPKLYRGKQKTFFFVANDGIRKVGLGTSLVSVPTELERKGDFSQSFTTQQINGQTVRFPIQIYNPLQIDANGNRAPFSGNVIPVQQLSPIAGNILKFISLPNRPSDPTGNATNNFVSNQRQPSNLNLIAVRLDQNWNNSQRTFATVRWAHSALYGNDYFGNGASGNVEPRTPKGAGIDHVWTLSPTKVLDLRFGVTRMEDSVVPENDGFDPTQLGFSKSFAAAQTRPEFPCITGFAGSVLGCAPSAITVTDSTYYTWIANLTHVKGNHTLKYGAEYWILQQSNVGIGQQGNFDFQNNWTTQNAITGGGTGVGSGFASFLLGLPTSGSMPRNATALYSQHYDAFYVHDDWRVTPKLTLNFGLRWDVEKPPTERFNRMTSNFDPAALNPISGAAQAAYTQILASNPSNVGVQTLAQLLPANSFKVLGAQLFAGVNGQSRAVYNRDWTEFQPRVGFAYRVLPNTVIRGGFGRFTQPTYDIGGQNGFSITTPLTATANSFLSPYDTLANPFQNGILQPTGSSLGALTNLGQNVSWFNQNPGRPYSLEYSFHLQHQIKDWLLEAGYTHNTTYHLPENLNQNLPSFDLRQQLLAPQFTSTGAPVATLLWNQLVPNPFFGLTGVSGSIATSKTIQMNQLLNPISILGVVTENGNPWGKNQYDALVTKAEHRFSKGFSLIGAFTWSRQFQETSFIGPQQLGVINHALGNEDRPLHLSIAPVWDIPIGRDRLVGSHMNKVLDAFVGGWQLSGVFTIQSGLPVLFNTDSFFSGKDFALPHSQQSLDHWFDTTQFLPFPAKNTNITNYPAWTGIQNLPGYNYKPVPSDGISNGVYQDFANFIRTYPNSWNDVRASRVNNVDAGIYKNLRILESVSLQYRFECYNAFNHARFPAPDTSPASATFGQVPKTEVNQPRVVQMALKLYF